MPHPNYNDYRSLFPPERPVSTPPLATFAGGGGVILISAGASSNIGTAFSFSDDNNVSFGISNGSITASASYLAQTVQTQGLVTVQGSTGAIVFSNSNGVSFGGNNSTITASFSQSNQPVYFSASGGVSSANTLSFINSNGVTFSNSNGSIIASISVPSGAFRVSAGTVTSDLTNIVFSNSNGITFGLNGATVTATVATNYLTTQSNQTIGAYGVGNTTQGSSGTLDARSLSLRGGGIVSVGYSNGSLVVSASAAGAGDGYNIIAAGTQTANSTGTVKFSNSGGVTFGMNNSSIVTATVATNYMASNKSSNFVQATAPFAGTNASGTIGSDGISVSVAAQSVVPQNVSLYALGNTTQNSSTFLSLNALSFKASGSLTIGYSNGTIQFSAADALTSQTVQTQNNIAGVIASNTTYETGTISFKDGNGLSWGSETGQGISLTHDLQYTSATSAITSLALNTSAARIRGIIGSDTTYTSGSVGFRDLNGITWQSTAGQSFQITHALQYTSATSAITSAALHTSVSRVINIIGATDNTGGGTASLSSNVSFSNANNFTFYTSAGNAIVGSFSQSIDTRKAGTGFTSGGNNIGISGTLNTNGLSFSATVAAQTNQTVGIYGSSQTTGSASSGTHDARSLSFIGAGAISIGNHSTSVGGTTTGIIISAPVQSIQTQGMVSVNGSTGNISFVTGSSLSSSVNGSTITWGLASNITTALQSAGAYLTTAALSTQTLAFTLSGNTATTNSSQILNGGYALAGGNGVTLQQSNNTLSFSVATNYQSQGAYLTTAALSTQTNAFSLGGNTGTTNSSVLSAGGYVIAGGSNITLSMSNNSLSIHAQSQSLQTQSRFNLTLSGNSTSGGGGYIQVSSGVLSLAGGNNITLSQDGNAITISGANAGGVQTGISGIAASNTTYTSGSVTFRDGNGISWASTTGQQISITHALQYTSQMSDYQSTGAYLTTAAQSTQTFLASLGGNTGTTNSSRIGNGGFVFAGGNGVTINQSNNSVSWSVATNYQSQGAYLTTARGSTDAIGLNTAQSNVTWTANSSGLSLDARGYAGTGTTFNGANISGSITQNSVGVQLSLSVAAPGAAAENNWFNLLGANTAGNTTASGSTIGLSGINLTLSGTNNSAINISAPATSSISGTGAVSISVNGSTISIGVPVTTFNSSVFGKQLEWAQSSTSMGQNSLYFFPELVHDYISGSVVKFPVMVTLSSSGAGAFTRGHTASFAVYTRQAGTNSTAITRIYSTSYTAAAVMSSNANMSISIITAVGNSTSYSTVAANSAGLNLSASVHGAREFIMPWATLLAPGEYWMGYAQSSSSAGGVGNVLLCSHIIGSSSTQNRMGVSANNSLGGIQQNIGLGTYSATSGGWPAAVTLTQIQGGGTWPIAFFLIDTV